MFVLCLARRYKFLFHIYLLLLAGAVSSCMVPNPYVALVNLGLSPRKNVNSKCSDGGYDRHLCGQRLVPPQVRGRRSR